MVFMKKNAIISIMNLCLVMNFVCCCFAGTVQDVPESIRVEQMVTPMVVEFYRPSCPHCQSMTPVYARVAAECNNGVNFYRVNTDKSTTNEICKMITSDSTVQVSGVPTFVFVNKNGTTNGKEKLEDYKKRVTK